jgi:ABC-2 type transport system ATP-binding protein
VPPVPALVAELAAWLAERDLQLGDLRAGRQRLEDVFLRLTGSATAKPASGTCDSASSASERPSRRRRARR